MGASGEQIEKYLNVFTIVQFTKIFSSYDKKMDFTREQLTQVFHLPCMYV